MTLRLFFCAAALAFSATVSSMPIAARATTLEYLDVPALTQHAQLVVLGRVMRSSSAYDARGNIVTTSEVRVGEVAKGRAKAGETVQVRTLGGVVGDIAMRVPGEARLAPGRDVLLFLRAGQRDPSRLRVVGMGQGIRWLKREGAHWVASPQPGAVHAMDASGKPAPQPVAQRLDELLTAIRSAAK